MQIHPSVHSPFVKVSKRQMNPSENALLAPKYGLMDSEALLGRFAKYTLTPHPLIWHPNSMKTDSRDIIRTQYQETYRTFSHLSIGRFRQQTRGEQFQNNVSEMQIKCFFFRTLDFGGWNNIVWEVKHLCLARQTILFDEWNNIVSRYNYSFLPRFLHIHANRFAWIFLKKPTLPDFSKVRVSRKQHFHQFCKGICLTGLQSVNHSRITIQPKKK